LLPEGVYVRWMAGVPLEPSSAQRMSLGSRVLDFLDEWLDRRNSAPASWPRTDERLIEELLREPGEDGRELESLLEAVGRATETGFDTAGGGFMSYIPSGGLYTAALGALLGSVTNQYTGGAHASPGMTAIEESVIRWMTGLFGLPTSAGGVLVSGGSIANLIAVVTARSRFGDDFRDGVIYTSTHGHHSIQKAARIAGISTARITLVDTDERRRLDAQSLERCIAQDSRRGLRAMMVVANAGTTDTGAIDPLHACADIAADAGAWFHADAAYGGFFQLTERGRARLSGIERADSITIDAHKSLFLPFGVGGLLMRDPAAVAEAHEGAGAYMQDIATGDLPHYMEMGPELTRPNRGLQVWLALNLHGVRPFRDELDRMLDLSDRMAVALGSVPGIEVLDAPQLSIVAFRARSGDAATRAILDALLASEEVHVSSTTIDGHLYGRFALLSQRTSDAVVDRAIDIVRTAAGPSIES
jgi:aromatic-L-amino-acid decarboxylase